MRPSVALNKNREAIYALVELYRAANPRVFGSAARCEDNDDSNLDLLVDALPGTTLFELGNLHHELEKLLGIRVNLRTPGELPVQLRHGVIADARPV